MQKFINITNKTAQDFGVKSMQELWEKSAGEVKGFSCEIPVTIEKNIIKSEKGEDETEYTMVASDDKKDRHGDIVMQNWVIGKNIPLLDSHNYESITHILGNFAKPETTEHQLKGKLKFSKANPKGVLAREMTDEGSLDKSSVGFIPLEFDKDGRITKSELLEVSMVSVPANPRAQLEKKVEEAKAEIKEIEEKIETAETEEIKELEKKVDKETMVLSSILKGLNNVEKKNQKKEELKRAVFKALRTL